MSQPETAWAANPLIAALASEEPEIAERAKAQIVARGSDAVTLLLHCLDADGDGLRVRSLSLLALLGDARAAGPVASLLRHPDPLMRARAAAALARIASPSTTPALSRLLAREKDVSVRLAATRSLVRLVQTGHDEALRPLLEVLANPDDEPRVRTAAMEALPWTTAPGNGTGIQAMLLRLSEDAATTVAQKARRMLKTPPRPRLEPWAIEKLLRDLRSERLSTWRRAVSRLGRAGSIAVEPLLDELNRSPNDALLAARAVLVLKALSPRQLTRLGPFMDQCAEPVPLEALVEVVAAAGSRALLARLAALIRRLAERADASPGPFDRVRQCAHLALARHGSRLAAEDLRRLLEDRRVPIRPELAEAAAEVGTRRDLPTLVRAYRRSRGVARLALRDAVITVCRREKIRRTDRALAALEPNERTAAVEILGSPRRKAPRRRIARIERVTSPLLT